MTQPIQREIQTNYGRAARSGLSSAQASVSAVAEAFGYSAEELTSIPAEANLGLSCGNPTAFASLQPGEVVVDLGCGGGLDVFLAARKIGPTGRAIGIDMTPEMIELARRNAGRHAQTNCEFYKAAIDRLPLADATVDCIISNCVINLAVDKPAVFREIARVLKPGGRVAISDIVLKQPLPPELAADLMAYIGCIAGAIQADEYRVGLLAAGLEHVEVVDTGADLNAYTLIEGQAACCSPVMSDDAHSLPVASACCETEIPPGVHQELTRLAEKYDLNTYAASARIYGVRAIKQKKQRAAE
jgi:SAM-dependent methyltransferase